MSIKLIDPANESLGIVDGVLEYQPERFNLQPIVVKTQSFAMLHALQFSRIGFFVGMQGSSALAVLLLLKTKLTGACLVTRRVARAGRAKKGESSNEVPE